MARRRMSRTEKLLLPPEVGNWPKISRYGIDSGSFLTDLGSALGQIQQKARKPEVRPTPSSPSISKNAPSIELANAIQSMCLGFPDMVSDLEIRASIRGSDWASASRAASKISSKLGYGLQIRLGAGDQIGTSSIDAVPVSIKFLLPSL